MVPSINDDKPQVVTVWKPLVGIALYVIVFLLFVVHANGKQIALSERRVLNLAADSKILLKTCDGLRSEVANGGCRESIVVSPCAGMLAGSTLPVAREHPP